MITDKPDSKGPGRGDAEAASPIEFYLDRGSGLPTYRQLVQQVDRALLLGYLRRGDRLPRVKDVTSTLAINPDTVLKAYRELEHRGIAEGRPGQGTFIVAEPTTAGLREMTALRRSLTGWVSEATAAGLDQQSMAALFASVLHDVGTAAESGAHAGPGADAESGAHAGPGADAGPGAAVVA